MANICKTDDGHCNQEELNWRKIEKSILIKTVVILQDWNLEVKPWYVQL